MLPAQSGSRERQKIGPGTTWGVSEISDLIPGMDGGSSLSIAGEGHALNFGE